MCDLDSQDRKMDRQYEQTTKSLFFPSVSIYPLSGQ